jgi:2-haloalkanoic acid dehalogenase type II
MPISYVIDRHGRLSGYIWLHYSRGRMDLRAGAGLSRLLCQRLKTTELEQLGSLRGVRACVFDAYCTLFDFGSAARQCRDALGDYIERLTKLWRDKQLQYTWLRAAQGRYADFRQVTGDALDSSLETLNLDAPGLRDRLMALYLTLDPFPEVRDVLGRLQAAGLRTAIYRTARRQCFEAAVKSPKLGPCWTKSFPSRRSGYINHIRRYTSWPSIG